MVKMATKRAVDIANIRADIIEKTLKILTPEQRTKFVSLLKERR
jgi:Spy/CpxP family protein refolding chaperone